jgi:hypothetical protein
MRPIAARKKTSEHGVVSRPGSSWSGLGLKSRVGQAAFSTGTTQFDLNVQRSGWIMKDKYVQNLRQTEVFLM